MSVGRIRILAMLEADSISGSAKGVVEFIREARRHHAGAPEIEITVLRFRRSGTPAANSLTAAVERAAVPLETVEERGRFDRRVIPQLRARLAERQSDIVWSNSVKSHFLVRYAGLNRTARWVASHHGYTTTDLKMRVYNRLDRWSLPAADRLLTVCNPFADELAGYGIPRERIRVQHMPIRPFEASPDADIQALRRELALPSDAPVLLSIGRLSHEKGHADLLAAFAELRRSSRIPSATRLVLVGDGRERGPLEQHSRKLGLHDFVTLTGHRDDVRTFYSLAHVFVLPSHSEGSPNALLEAMAAGVPVVATAVGGVPEIATNGKNALLVPRRDQAALGAAVARLLNDVGLREQFRRASREVLDTHAPEVYFRSLAAVFQEAALGSVQAKRTIVAPHE